MNIDPTATALSRRDLFRVAGVAGATVIFSGTATAPADAATAIDVTGWGGTDTVHGDTRDQLRIEVAATGGDPLPLGSIQVYGQTFTVAGKELQKPDGTTVGHRTCGALGYDESAGTLVLKTDGTAGSLTVFGETFTPPVGDDFPPLTLVAANGTKWILRGSVRSSTQPDHAKIRAEGAAALVAVLKLSDYLDTRRSPSGGWLNGSGYGPEVVDESQGIAGIGTGYLQLSYLTGDAGHRDRAKQAFDWLVANQPANGAWGFPWAWGRSKLPKHFNGSVASHYENGEDHPAGTPYSVNALLAGRALLTAYGEFKDESYLSAANRVRDYILSPETGFQWLDAARIRGSVPYCNLLPIFPPDFPLIAKHDVHPRLQNTSVDVYNVDAFAVRFLDHLRAITGEQRLTRYIRALLTNLLHNRLPSGSIPYAWCNPSEFDFYTYAVGAAFTRYATFHQDQRVLEAGRQVYTRWVNLFKQVSILSEAEGAVPHRTDNTKAQIAYLKGIPRQQLPDGSWSAGKNTRQDADMLNALTMTLLQVGYNTTDSLAPTPSRQSELFITERIVASVDGFADMSSPYFP
jgi:hypothetical protein